jgi:putative oxidoreductase
MATTSIPSVGTSISQVKRWNILLWTAQVILGGMFLMAGIMKATTPIQELALKMPWINDSGELVRFIGIAEIAGALGLLLPSLLRIKPALTPLAAVGIVIIMVLASILHLTRGEYPAIGINFVLGAVAALIAYGRTKKAPIAAR